MFWNETTNNFVAGIFSFGNMLHTISELEIVIAIVGRRWSYKMLRSVLEQSGTPPERDKQKVSTLIRSSRPTFDELPLSCSLPQYLHHFQTLVSVAVTRRIIQTLIRITTVSQLELLTHAVKD